MPGHLGGSTSSDIIVSASDIKLRPISILDSLGTLQEAKAIMHENRFINPRRVLRNNEFDDESSGEKYQYYESGSDKDSSNSDSEAKENKYTESKIRANSLDNIAEPKVTYDDKYWKEKNPEKYLKEEYAEEKTITRSSEYLAEAKVIYDDKYWKDKHSEEKNKRWTIPGELKLRELDIQDRNNSDLGLNSNNITHSSSVGRIREVLSTEKSIKPTNPSVNLDLWNGNKKKRSKSGDGSPPWIPSGAANSLRSSSAGRIRQTLSREDSIKSVNSDTGKGLWEGGNKKRSKSTGKPPWMPPGSGR